MKIIFSMFIYFLQNFYSFFDFEFVLFCLSFWTLHSFVDWSRGFFR